jgi:diadenosine tetraphosphate (Ap4A) HIT family hydrolase
MFTLHPQLANNCILIGDLELCRVLLLNDCQYPWVILVPRRDNISESFQLTADEQSRLMWESSHVAELMNEFYTADKMNVAALGNVVPQLHIHHIVRYKNDAVWPKPVWGAVPGKAYSAERLSSRCTELRDLLKPLDWVD